MEIFWKAVGGSLIALILGMILEKRSPDAAIVLTLLVCCMLLGVAMRFLSPIIDFYHTLSSLGGLDRDNMEILMKATALGLISQISSMLCADAGNSALGKGIEIVAVCAILWISLPLLSSLVELIGDVVGQL